MRPQEDIFLKRLVKTGEKYPKCSCLNVSNSLNSYISHNAAQYRLLFTTSLTYNRPARWFVTQNDLETVCKKGSRHFHKKYFFEYTKPTFLESRCQTSVSLSSKKKKKERKITHYKLQPFLKPKFQPQARVISDKCVYKSNTLSIISVGAERGSSRRFLLSQLACFLSAF